MHKILGSTLGVSLGVGVLNDFNLVSVVVCQRVATIRLIDLKAWSSGSGAT